MVTNSMKFERFFISTDEKGTQLEIVSAKPEHDGPHPTIVFNHATTDKPNESSFRPTLRMPICKSGTDAEPDTMPNPVP